MIKFSVKAYFNDAIKLRRDRFLIQIIIVVILNFTAIHPFSLSNLKEPHHHSHLFDKY
jgi:hypothetical protein